MMGHNLRAACGIGWVTFMGAIRSRLLMVSFVFAIVLIVVSVAAASVSFGHVTRIIVDVGLATASGVGSVIALALTISVIASEARNHTVHTIVSRPISRWVYVLGQYLGLVFVMWVVVTLMVLATAATVALYGGTVPDALWISIWLSCVEMTVVISVAMLFAHISVPTLAASYTAGVLVAGNLAADILEMARVASDKGIESTAIMLRVFYHVVPDLQDLSVRAQAANNLPVSSELILNGTLYALAYAFATLVGAMWLFSRKAAV